ncbi:biotin transporter BioY [Salinibacterium sp. SWN167]|uniref:biotin transporter BioY n=1 Tax=Salinibacterium sp. SWN167 TaxID=2792054 RepID=UPI0018CCDA84|nr:biotin transporter BioY [Salinibacterium sp. SWN167]MBH0083488.1 biotin transporter BioY [Salinibacterium sp. SWN167]
MSIATRLIKPTIVDLIFGPSWAASVIFVAAGAGFTALAAQFVVPLYPVPITGQTLAVMIVGLSLGATRAALAMTLYALLGVVGLPVFSDSSGGLEVLTGTGGGYIVGYILGAWIMGALAERHWDRRFWKAVAAAAIGTAAIYAAGLIGLARALTSMGRDYTTTSLLDIGVTPFLVGAAVKVIVAATLLSYAWKKAAQHDPQAAEQR